MWDNKIEIGFALQRAGKYLVQYIDFEMLTEGDPIITLMATNDNTDRHFDVISYSDSYDCQLLFGNLSGFEDDSTDSLWPVVTLCSIKLWQPCNASLNSAISKQLKTLGISKKCKDFGFAYIEPLFCKNKLDIDYIKDVIAPIDEDNLELSL